ncbi:MAG TPA: hypothetical protein VK651_10780 [Blastocatellia bacterium]|nr:hypothetical protein [Blastocatellia bacterium]
MKIRDRSTKLISIVLFVATLTTLWTIWGANRAEAVIAIIRQTGVFSLTQGQATSAHVVNTGEERGIIVDYRVLDSAANVLVQSDRRRVELGQASSFDFGPLDLAEGQRMAIRVELRVEGASRNKPGFIATQEVYNTGNGKTTVFLPYLE